MILCKVDFVAILRVIFLKKDTDLYEKRNIGVFKSFCRDDWIRTSDHAPPRRVL